MALGGPRQRAVLAMLALAAPDVVSTDRPIDGIWERVRGRRWPRFRVFIHNLRKACAKRPVRRTRSNGAHPATGRFSDPSAIDAARFEAHVAVARRAAT